MSSSTVPHTSIKTDCTVIVITVSRIYFDLYLYPLPLTDIDPALSIVWNDEFHVSYKICLWIELRTDNVKETNQWTHTVNRVIFAPCNIFACKQCCLVLNSPRHRCVQRKIIWDIGIRSVLVSLIDNEDEMGEYFPVYGTPDILPWP